MDVAWSFVSRLEFSLKLQAYVSGLGADIRKYRELLIFLLDSHKYKQEASFL